MSEITDNLIAQQRAQLETWHTDATEIGNFIADEVWDTLERQLEDLTNDGLLWDCAEAIKGSLLMTLATGFDAACEKWITSRIETLSEAMQALVGPAWDFDSARSSLDNLRKSLRIRQRMAPRFDQLFEKAKPGVFRIINRVLTDDVDYVLNDMDKDAQTDAARLRSVVYTARAEVVSEIAVLAAELLRRAVHDYRSALAKASPEISIDL